MDAGDADAAGVPALVGMEHAVEVSPVGACAKRQAAVARVGFGESVGIDGFEFRGAIEDAGGAPDVFPENVAEGGLDCDAIGVAEVLEGIHPVVVVRAVGHGGDGQLALVGGAHGHVGFVFGPGQGGQEQRGQDGDDGDDHQQLNQREAGKGLGGRS